MKKVKQRVGVLGAGVLALLGSFGASAATVTVTPSVVTTALTPIGPLGTFNVVVSSADMPVTSGTTLGLTYDASRVSVTSIVFLAPFTFATWLAGGTPGTTDSVAVLNTGATLVGGPFDAFQLNFSVLNNATTQTTVADANIRLVDDGADFGWSDPDAVTIQGVAYNQASVFVGTVPAPATAWLLATALGFVGVKGVKAKRSRS